MESVTRWNALVACRRRSSARPAHPCVEHAGCAAAETVKDANVSIDTATESVTSDRSPRPTVMVATPVPASGAPITLTTFVSATWTLLAPAVTAYTARWSTEKSCDDPPLAGLKKAHGDVHPLVASGLNNLAALLQDQGKLAEAEPLARESLAIFKKEHGDVHEQVALGLNNLAALLQAQGKLAEAEPLSREALAVWKNVFGDEHPKVAIGLHNLALLLQQQGKAAEAARLGKQALAIFEEKLGPDHRNTQQLRGTWGDD